MKIIFIFCCVLITISCDNNDTNDVDIINIKDNVNNFKELKLSDYNYDEVRYVPLNYYKQLPISTIKHFDIKDSLILINDSDNCFLYKFNGEIVSKIGIKGKGPEEYHRPVYVKINDRNECMIQSGDKILIYDYHGVYISSIKLPFSTSSLPRQNGRNWLAIKGGNVFCHLSNYNGITESKAITIDKYGHKLKSYKNYEIFSKFREANTLMSEAINPTVIYRD